jgi:Eukaryotic aspartyl protease
MTGQLPIDNMLFGIYIKETADAFGGTGEINFGSPNTDRFVGTLNEVPNVSQQGAWEAPVVPPLHSTHKRMTSKSTALQWISRIKQLRSRPLQAVCLHLMLMLAWIQLPIADATKVLTALTSNFFQTDGQGQFALPCSTQTELEFVLGGVGYHFNPTSYVNTQSVNSTFPNGTTMCQSLILGIDEQDPVWIFGSPFLMNVSIPDWYWVRLILRCIRSSTFRRKQSHLLLRYSECYSDIKLGAIR